MHVIHVILYNTHKEPKFPSGKVLISYLIRMIIKFSCAVPDIDQLILLLSIPEMWNLERNIMGFDFRNVFIKISSGSESMKRKKQKQVVRTPRRDRNLYIIWKASYWLCRWNA